MGGFDPRVQEQLAQISYQSQQASSHSQSSQSSASHVSQNSQYSTHIHPRIIRNSEPSRNYNIYHPQAPPGSEAFPPLGSNSTSNMSAMYVNHANQQHPDQQANHRSQSAAQEFFARARGRGRGRGRNRGNGPVNHQSFVAGPNDFSRPAAQEQRLYNPHQSSYLGSAEQQRAGRQRLMEQSDFLQALATQQSSNMLTRQEIEAKQNFARQLESLARDVVLSKHLALNVANPSQVKLQPYGSLANSFGTAGCDVDLLLTIESMPGMLAEISEDLKRDFEKALLELGIGARLLTNTRIPILRVCERPGKDLLRNLRDHRSKWEQESAKSAILSDERQDQAPLPKLTDEQKLAQAVKEVNLDPGAAEVPLPQSPNSDHVNLEYIGDCGIQCDINFKNYIAILNSKLLWTYGQCDKRVRLMGIFVKTWAKARDLNTPYRGTLSSYGYILMVLHYLINVAHPPLLPNLQELGKSDGWTPTPVEVLEGHDVRFCKDLTHIKQIMASMQPNHTSLGALLAGFFRYYGVNQGGFRWMEEVISIRTPGGILTKQQKGWVRAKWADENPNVRQRYLLAIEDPFEINHNVGRTVGHNGNAAIRDEFRRAWDIVQTVTFNRVGQGPAWAATVDGQSHANAMNLVATVESRGDLLRKDADGRREKAAKARELRQALEQQEQVVRDQALQDGHLDQNGVEHGMWTERDLRLDEVEDAGSLIHNVQHQDEKVSRMRSRMPARRRLNDEQDSTEPDEDAGIEPSSWEIEPEKRSEEKTFDTKHCTANREPVPTAHTLNRVTEDAAQRDSEYDLKDHPLGRTHEQDSTNLATEPKTNDNASITPEAWQSQLQAQTHVLDADTVGPIISWTENSVAGRWLRKRDALMRSGQWNAPTADETGRLHTKFPNNPHMTTQELAALNERLETYYKHTLYPQLPTDQQPENLEPGKIALDATTTVADVGWPQVETHSTSRPQEKSAQDWPVRQDIPWSAQTETGRWLLWRDRKLRQGESTGNNKRWNDLFKRLNELFPYEVEKTLANVERMNLELDTLFHNIVFPRGEMPYGEQTYYARQVHDAIEETIAQRRLEPMSQRSAANEELLKEVYPAARKVRFVTPSLQNVTSVPEPVAMSFTPSYDDQLQWTCRNDVGRWLSYRDEMTVKGKWNPNRRREGSIFTRLEKLYPYDANLSKDQRIRQNAEIEEYFSDIELPRSSQDNSEDPWKAISVVEKHRQSNGPQNKQDAEKTRVRSLLSTLTDQTLGSLQEAHRRPRSTTKTLEQKQTEERCLRAIEALSSQLPKRMSEPVQDQASQEAPTQQPTAEAHNIQQAPDDATFVRQQRLAFFEQRVNTLTPIDTKNHPTPTAADVSLHKIALNDSQTFGSVAKGSSLDDPTNDCAVEDLDPSKWKAEVEPSVRRDSGAEGSWNNPSSPSRVSNYCGPSPFEDDANAQQNTTNRFLPTTLTGSTTGIGTQYDPVTTDESGDKVVPNTLKPETWRSVRKDRFEDPRIMPIMRRLDFKLDDRQLRDMEAIRRGGNGCARDGVSPFMLESDQHSWGGAGAMAQRSDSPQWCWSSRFSFTANSSEEEDRKQVLAELPGFVEL